jgi:hypothetical protein
MDFFLVHIGQILLILINSISQKNSISEKWKKNWSKVQTHPKVVLPKQTNNYISFEMLNLSVSMVISWTIPNLSYHKMYQIFFTPITTIY